jgi:hypothetical protein
MRGPGSGVGRRSLVVALVVAGLAALSPAASAGTHTQWSVLSPPSAPNGGPLFYDVSCPDLDDCVAVGYETAADGTFGSLIAERRIGATWTLQEIPLPAGMTGALNGVSCPDIDHCIAVGHEDPTDDSRGSALIARYSSGVWTIDTHPSAEIDNPSGTFPFDELDDVSCVDVSDCVAVGFYGYSENDDSSEVATAQVLTSSGGTWSLATVAGPRAANLLVGVSCADALHCVAVGASSSGDAGGTFVPMAFAMSAGAWNAVPINGAPDQSLPQRVSCWSATGCAAVGYSITADGNGEQPLTLQFDGTQLTATSSPVLPATSAAVLSDVSCAAAGSCIAVGYDQDNAETPATPSLTERLQDGVWTVESDFAPPHDEYLFMGVTCVLGGCNAVGLRAGADGQSTTVGLQSLWAVGVPVSDTTPSAITSGASTSVGMRTPFDFHVSATGVPTPALSESGALPAGVTFTANGDGTADLAGAASAGTAGVYPITITAANGAGDPATQHFVLTVTSAASVPAITSSSTDTETFGVPFSFTIGTTGYPAPKLTKSGSLPAGVTFSDNGNGTATIAGTPAKAAVGEYALTLTAKSSAGATTQSFTLAITKAPAIKKVPATTISAGSNVLLTITASGYTVPSLSESGALPSGLGFADRGDGTATIAGTPANGSGGSYSITVTATNALGSSSQTFILKVDQGPVITSPAAASATIGSAFSFAVTSTGFPAPRVTKVGTLPKGITFDATTDTFSGTPKARTAGSYAIQVTAANTTGSVTQQLVISVQ